MMGTQTRQKSISSQFENSETSYISIISHQTLQRMYFKLNVVCVKEKLNYRMIQISPKPLKSTDSLISFNYDISM